MLCRCSMYHEVSNQKIAIEMQREKTLYFLVRSQVYMSKLIAGQVKEGEGDSYNVLETHILVIATTTKAYLRI